MPRWRRGVLPPTFVKKSISDECISHTKMKQAKKMVG